MKHIVLILLSFSMYIQAQNNTPLVTPPYLKKGDTIAILAPAGILKPYKKPAIDKAKKLAESWGLNVVYGKNLYSQDNHFAGTDEQRCQDFQEALDNPNIKAIWCGRGGYGSVRLLDKLNFDNFIKTPKWIIGYSDITAFHSHVHTLGIESLHAMMGTSMQDKAEDIPYTIESFKKALFGEKITYTIPSSSYNREGAVSGQLVGGNIAILASMLASESQISTVHKILFIEEVGEYKYSIDRMLQSFKRAGYFKNVKAVVVGGMTKIKKNSTPWGTSIEQLIVDAIPAEIPIVFNFPAGHDPDNRALIMGRFAELKITEKTSTITFKD